MFSSHMLVIYLPVGDVGEKAFEKESRLFHVPRECPLLPVWAAGELHMFIG